MATVLSSPIFGRGLKIIAAVLIFIYFLLAVYFVVGRYYLQQLPDYTKNIETALYKQTGLQWQIEGLHGRWHGINPVINVDKIKASRDVSGLALSSKNHNESGTNSTEPLSGEVLSADAVHVYVDIFASVVNRELRLYGAQANRVAVVLQKNSHNKFTLAGIKQRSAKKPFNVTGFVDHLRYFSLETMDVNIEHQTTSPRQIIKIPSINMRLKRHKLWREFSLLQRATADSETAESLDIAIFSDGAFFSDKSKIVGQLSDNGSGLAQWLNIFSDHWQLKKSIANIWFEKQSHHYEWLLSDVSGVVSQPLLNKNLNDEQSNSLSSNYHFNVDLRLIGDSKTAQLDWQNISLSLNEKPLYTPIGRVAFDIEQAQFKKASVFVEELDVALLASTINKVELLKAREQRIIKTLNPKGTLQQLLIEIPLDKPKEFLLSANLNNVAVDSWKGSPAANKVNGKLFVSATDGCVELDSREGFSLFFASIYHEPMVFSEATATVSWRIAGPRFFVSSDNVALKSSTDDAIYGGQFAVNGRTAADGEPSHLLLNIGVTSAQVPDLLAYIPHVAPQSLLKWTQQSQAAGYVESGAFIFNGPLQKSGAAKRSINAYFQLTNSELIFYKDWPQLQNVNALLSINNSVADIELYSANLQGFSLGPSVATVNASSDAGYVDVDGLASGNVNSILSFLRETPLSEGLAKQLKDWRGEGAFDRAVVNLHIPFAQDKQDALAVDIKLLLSDAQLTMHNLNIFLEGLNGEIGFDSINGLYASQLEASLWGHAVQLKLGDYSNTEQLKGMTSLRLQATSRMDIASINQWLKQPALAFTSGVTAFDFLLEHTAESSHLYLHSDLEGIKFDLPIPLYKNKSRKAELDLHWDLLLATQPMSITIKHHLTALFNFDNFQLSGGLLLLGDEQIKNKALANQKQHRVAENKLLISGYLPTLNLEHWQKFVTDYIDFDEKLNPVLSENKGVGSEIKLIVDDFRIRQVTAFDQQFDNAVIDVQSDTLRWIFNIESDQFGGVVKLPENISVEFEQVFEESGKVDNGLQGLPQVANNSPMSERFIIDLDYLRLPSNKLDSNAGSLGKASGILAWDMPNLQFDVSQLYFGERPLGRWHFLFNSGDKTILVHDLKVEYASLNLSSDKDAGLLWAADKHGNITTSLEVDISSHAFTKFVDAVMNDKDALPLSSKDFNASMSLSWNGFPEEVTFEKLNGELSFKFGSGRFLKTSESATGVLKILGLLNFDALVRRVRLDFSDVYKNGLSFDKISGQLDFSNNQIKFLDTPINVFSPGSKFSLVGGLDLSAQTIDADLIMTLPVASNLPWIAALAGGLPVAAGAFIVTKVLDKQLNKLSSAVYRVGGSLNDPQVSFDRIFDDSSNKSSP